jgi:hypothetical protein
LDSIYAAPRFVLAQLLDQNGRLPEALTEYRAFLARSSLADGRNAEARERVAALSSPAPTGDRE